jgi:hypothetical protein
MRLQAQAVALSEAVKLLGISGSNLIGGMQASADFLGNGAIEINKYETEITDILRRESPSLVRLKNKGCWTPATGHPHRYFEQIAIATAAATDPRNITPAPSGPTRVERPAMLKAVTAQSNFSHFDVEVTQQQGQFAKVEAKDISDIIKAIILKQAQMLWMGSDTSLSAPTTLEWVGAIQQLASGGNVIQVLKGSSIIDGIKTEVATLMASTLYGPRPTCVYLNPLLADLIDQEAKAAAYRMNEVEFVAGVQVNGVQTGAGVLPFAPDPFLPQLSNAQLTALGLPNIPSGSTVCYVGVITQEDMIELPYVNPNGGPDPRIFQLGLLAGLQGQFVGIAYDSLIFKGASYAHALVLVYR